MNLPPGLVARPLVMSDASAVHALFAAAELADTGEVAVELEDIEGGWQRPSFDLEQESIGVFENGTLVAAGEVYKTRRAEATVHPDHRGRGIGTWLARWVEDCSRRRGGSLVGQSVPVGGSAERLYQSLGYREGWRAWVLVVPEGAAIEPQPLPRGYVLRDLVVGEDEETAYRLVEDAFNEWPDRQPSTFDDWAASTVRRPGFEPWQIRFAVDDRGTAVGVAFLIVTEGCGYVDQLAVRSDQRGKGLARALLVDAFARAREHGAARSELSTDSRTGALPLYEHVGMQVSQSYQHWMTDV
ncbi:GNAT family N-acetyltransferase [Phycicoccus sp. Root101]|uniref:GNAT family N-acetyltransferase n=1 Tax=Phycicoccus sp. Root101 TaxID=1736421 RepID=UPI0007031155|nr:GNAT family N-acetyltransferase [Phycicoccus sp. Root101]KQU66369.1 GCN5 family acetyltransferase [Phycicoccus sp. Root101]